MFTNTQRHAASERVYQMIKNQRDSDYKSLLASDQTLQLLRAACRKRFARKRDCQEECVSFIMEKLLQDDCRRLRAYEGRAAFSTFLHTCINRLALDFLRHKQGRKRHPTAVARLGNLAMRLYALLCWRRYSRRDAYEQLCSIGEYEGGFAAFLQEMQPVLEAHCPEDQETESLTAEDGMQRDVADRQNSPLDSLLDKLDMQRRILASRVIHEVTASLPVTEQTLVRLIYAEGISLAKAARSLGLQTHVARRRLNGVLTIYKEKLLQKGISER